MSSAAAGVSRGRIPKWASTIGRRVAEQLRWLLAGYAQVLFTTRPVVGGIAALATFLSPEHGMAGLIGLVFANLGAVLLELDPQHRKDGFFAFNGLLVGLALGLYYRLNLPFFLAIALGGVLVAAIAAALRAFFERHLTIPVLSLPFLLVAWLLYAAAARFPGLEVTLAPVEVPDLGVALVPWLDAFFRSCGALFFQLSTASGVLVAAALLVWSRIGFLLAVVGYAAGQAVYISLGGNPVDLTGQLLGFNFIITAVAVGGVWTVATLPGFVLAAVAGAATAVVAAAAAAVLPRVGLPVLAFPLIATTMALLLALRGRPAARRLIQPALLGATPEATLREHRIQRERFVPGDRLGLPLPVGGRYRVTQSFDGPHTHRDEWRHGIDIEAVDQDGALFRNTGVRVDGAGPYGAAKEDYYAFGAPVLAPLAGRVVNVVSHITDNPVGEVDHEHPWGNTIVLWHGGSLYSGYSHLAEGSSTVSVGMDVASGQVIGKIGSSGRSPRPHLHFQSQASPNVGAPTRPWTLLHWLTPEPRADGKRGELAYHTHGVPAQDDDIETVAADPRLAGALAFPLGLRWRFRVEQGEGRPAREESWTAELDFASRLWLVSHPSGARLRLYRSPYVFLAEAYEGSQNTALHRLYRGMPRMPLTDRDGLAWSDRLEPDRGFGWAMRLLAELALPAGRVAWLDTRSRLGTDIEGRRTVTTTARLAGPLADRARKWELVVRIEPDTGVERIEERCSGEPDFVATLVEVEPTGEDEQERSA